MRQMTSSSAAFFWMPSLHIAIAPIDYEETVLVLG